MWDSVRSTWPVDGPGGDSLPPGSRDNASVLSAALVPLWSSNLVDPSSRCPLGSIQSHLASDGRLWSLACRWKTRPTVSTAPPAPVEFLRSLVFQPWFYLFASYETFERSLSLSSEGIQEIPLVRFCEQTWLFCVLYSHQERHTVPGTPLIWALGCLVLIYSDYLLSFARSLVRCDRLLSFTFFWLLQGSEGELS